MLELLRFIGFPLLVLGVALSWLWLDRVTGWEGVRAPGAGATLVLLGSLLILWCTVLFAELGRGTPHPFAAKTKRLVASGPYSIVRNPMMWGVGSVLVGTALWVGSLGLWFGLALFVGFLLWFVPCYEEPDMQRRFGEEYREYCTRVPRWLPGRRRRGR